MKKILAMMLALAMLAMMMVACSEPAEGEDTSGDTAGETAGDTAGETEAPATDAPETEAPATEAPVDTEAPAGDEPNMFPYEGDVIPGSVDYDWGAPDAESVYFAIDEAHTIHDGKGTWSNSTGTLPMMAFDGDYDTCYDCDELCGSVNDENMNVGLVLENWDNDTTKTGYVGAWIEEGVVLSQIRFFPRAANLGREQGCKIQASVDGVEWVDLVVITELQYGGADYEFYDIDDDTVYYYVRFLARDLAAYQEYVDDTATEATDFRSYCNIAELEIWGTPAK